MNYDNSTLWGITVGGRLYYVAHHELNEATKIAQARFICECGVYNRTLKAEVVKAEKYGLVSFIPKK